MLLFYKTSLWANSRGSKFFVLGGGRTSNPDDCLFRMKKRFSREFYDFCIGTKIHSKKAYDYLCKIRDENINMSQINSQDNGYFPKYRDL
jgi:hypothetical protein